MAKKLRNTAAKSPRFFHISYFHSLKDLFGFLLYFFFFLAGQLWSSQIMLRRRIFGRFCLFSIPLNQLTFYILETFIRRQFILLSSQFRKGKLT